MDKKLSAKQIIVITSTLFGMLFGSGNLIFPVHMGQMAGSNFISATLGFIVTGVGLPVLSVIAIGISESNGIFSLASRVSKKFAYIYTIVLYLTIGPLFVMPRSASISYGAGLSSIVGDNLDQTLAFLIFSVLFFVVVAFFTFRPSGITTWIGKIITPVFLVFLAVLLFSVISNPMGSVFTSEPIGEYQAVPFFSGFLQGYGTMDVLAGLAYGIIIVNIIKSMGVKSTKGITKNMIIPSVVSAIMIAVIYVVIIVMGVESVEIFEPSSNGSIALNQISNYYFGLLGNGFLTAIVGLAAVKTSIALATSCAGTFCKMSNKKLSYNTWASIFICVSFLISNVGLDYIIDLSTPVLNFLYPISIVLIFLAFSEKWFDNSSFVYKVTIIFTAVPAIFSFVSNIPSYIVDALNIQAVIDFCGSAFPLAKYGFGWLIPALIGFIIAMFVYKLKLSKKVKNV